MAIVREDFGREIWIMKKKVVIVTDTVSSIPKKIAEEYGIFVVPMHVIMGGKD